MTFDLGIKRSNQGPLVSLGVYHRQCIINSGAFRPRGLLFLEKVVSLQNKDKRGVSGPSFRVIFG